MIPLLLFTISLYAQGPPRNFGRGMGPEGRGGPGGRGISAPRPDGKWWTSPFWIQRLSLTPDQQRQIEDTFQQYRLKLIDLRAALEKQEAILDPLLDTDHPPEARVLAQIDRIADARADLEKANARMLWGFRAVLTPDQWRGLQGGAPTGAQAGGPPRFP